MLVSIHIYVCIHIYMYTHIYMYGYTFMDVSMEILRECPLFCAFFDRAFHTIALFLSNLWARGS